MRLVYWVSHLWYSQAHAYWRWSQSTCLPLLILRTRIITLTLLSGDLRISRELSTCAAPFVMHDISVTPLWSLSQSQSPPLRSRSIRSLSFDRSHFLIHPKSISKITSATHHSQGAISIWFCSFPGASYCSLLERSSALQILLSDFHYDGIALSDTASVWPLLALSPDTLSIHHLAPFNSVTLRDSIDNSLIRILSHCAETLDDASSFSSPALYQCSYNTSSHWTSSTSEV